MNFKEAGRKLGIEFDKSKIKNMDFRGTCTNIAFKFLTDDMVTEALHGEPNEFDDYAWDDMQEYLAGMLIDGCLETSELPHPKG